MQCCEKLCIIDYEVVNHKFVGEITMHKRIREVRKSLGFTIEEFSRAMRVSKAVVFRYERPNARYSAEYLYRLWLSGINIDFIVAGVGEYFNNGYTVRAVKARIEKMMEGEL